MKFLVDNQLPGALSGFLASRGCDCVHVMEAGLGVASTLISGGMRARVAESWSRKRIDLYRYRDSME